MKNFSVLGGYHVVLVRHIRAIHCGFGHDSDLEGGSGGVRGERRFQSGSYKIALDGLYVSSGYHVGYFHPALKNFSKFLQEGCQYLNF